MVMEQRRWEQIEDIYYQAVQLPRDKRRAFLHQACLGDDQLRQEVDCLLDSNKSTINFLATPVFSLGMELLANEKRRFVSGLSIGPYQLLSMLGYGGMGEVFLAEDPRLGRKVAIKLLPELFTNDANRIRRFEQEARVASQISHPNIAHIYEIGNVDGYHFTSMEFVDGITLREMMQKRLDLGEAIDIALQVGYALVAAHQAGIVHRDIKPENIMVRKDRYVKVLDFGLAKLTEMIDEPIDSKNASITNVDTEPGILMGTPTYMSPEQLRGQTIEARTDIWSLGVTLYEMVSGRQPFVGRTASDISAAILLTEPDSLVIDRLNEDESSTLNHILSTALEKEIDQRYATVAAFVNELRQLQLKFNRRRQASGHGTHTAEQFGPLTPAFQRTLSNLRAVTVRYRPPKDSIVRLSMFVLVLFAFSGMQLASTRLSQVLSNALGVSKPLRIGSAGLFLVMHLLAGFVISKGATVGKGSTSISYRSVVLAMVLASAPLYLAWAWLPHPGIWLVYSLPYGIAALVGARLAFRANRLFSWQSLLAVFAPALILALTPASLIQAISQPKLLARSPKAVREYKEGTERMLLADSYAAVSRFNEATKLDDHFPLAQARFAEVWFELDYPEKANEALQKLTILLFKGFAPQRVEALYVDATKAIIKRDFPRSINSYREIAHLAPQESSIFVDLGRVYEMNGELDNAIGAYLEATKRDPWSTSAFLRLGKAYAVQKDEVKANNAFDQANRLSIDLSDQYVKAEVLHQRSLLAERLGRMDDARKYEENALISFNGNLFQMIRIQFHLACLWYAKDHRRGESYERSAVDLAQRISRNGLLTHGADELLTQGLVDLGNRFLTRGQLQEAQTYFQRALAIAERSGLKRNKARVWFAQGKLWLQGGLENEADRSFKAALKLEFPDRPLSDASIAVWRNVVCYNDYDTAIREFKNFS